MKKLFPLILIIMQFFFGVSTVSAETISDWNVDTAKYPANDIVEADICLEEADAADISEDDEDTSYVESSPNHEIPTDESGLSLGEEPVEEPVESTPDSPAEELTGASTASYLSITWQDGYVQKLKLGDNLSESAKDSKAKQVLEKMGLPKDTCTLTASTDGVDAVIRSRDYCQGDDEVRVLAHKGYYMTATENTLSAFRVARALGYHYVGGDVRFTKDDVPVVIHDSTINATARNADGSAIKDPVYVRLHTYQELLRYDYGLSTDPVWTGEKIPTLKEYMELCREIGLIPNIHIKPDNNLKKKNFESVAEIVIETGMQGLATYAANYAYYLKPIVAIDPVSIVDIVITDKWDPHYILDILKLKTGENRIELGIMRKLYAPSIAATCRFNDILLTTSANSESEAAALDKHVSMIATDGALPDAIIKGARKRTYFGGELITEPLQKTDYQMLAHANAGVMMRMNSSMPGSALRLDVNPAQAEVSMFRFERLSNGYYNILCSRNMLAVGVRGGSTVDGASVILTNRNTNFEAQMWEIRSNEDGSYSFINRHSGMALSVVGDLEKKGSCFIQRPHDGRSSQKFWLRKSNDQIRMIFYDSTVDFQLSGRTGSVSTKNNSAAAGANVEMVKNANDDAQKYRIMYSGDGYYRIVNVKSGLCLTLNTTGATGNVVSSAWANKSSQRWKIAWNGKGTGMINGTYRIQCKQGNAAITAKSVNAGANISTDWWTGKTTQQWWITTIK